MLGLLGVARGCEGLLGVAMGLARGLLGVAKGLLRGCWGLLGFARVC